MTLFAFLIQTVSFYMFYSTSRRAEISNDAFTAKLQKHKRLTTIEGLILLTLSFVLFAFANGIGVGIFLAFLSLMTIGSLIIIFVPLLTRRS